MRKRKERHEEKNYEARVVAKLQDEMAVERDTYM